MTGGDRLSLFVHSPETVKQLVVPPSFLRRFPSIEIRTDLVDMQASRGVVVGEGRRVKTACPRRQAGGHGGEMPPLRGPCPSALHIVGRTPQVTAAPVARPPSAAPLS